MLELRKNASPKNAKRAFIRAGEMDFSAFAPNTEKIYRAGIAQYWRFLRLKRLSPNLKTARRFLYGISRTKSPATFNLRARALRFFFEQKYFDDHKKLWEVRKLRGKKLHVNRNQEDYLKKDQVDFLSAHMSPRISLISQALFWTGCRISELVNIRNIDVKKPSSAGRPVCIIVTGKGEKVRSVYMPEPLYLKIKECFKGKKFLFETKYHGIYDRVYLSNEIREQAKEHGIKAHPHKFRHSKAMFLKDEMGLTPDQIAKALGHSDVSTTLKWYFHGTPSAEDQGMG